MKTLRLPALAALVGVTALILLAGRVHPARAWGYHFDRQLAIALARMQAGSLGIPADSWDAFVSTETRQELEYYKRRHPEDTIARNLSPYRTNVLLASADRRRSISVQLFPDGRIASWQRKEAGSKDWTMKSMRSSVDSTFHQLAGTDANLYHPATEGAATKEGLRFTWERTGSTASFQPTIDVIVQDGAVVHAETHYTFGRQFENEYDQRDDAMNWMSLVYLALTFVLGLSAVILYTIGTIRRRVNQRFALVFCAVNLLSIAAAFWLGSGLETLRSTRVLQGSEAYLAAVLSQIYWTGLAILTGLAAAGGGLFAAGALRRKWWGLRLACSRQIFSKQVGLSISAGFLAAPLLAAIPLVTSAVIPGVLWDPREMALLFTPHPIVQTADSLLHPIVVILFAVVFGLVWNRALAATVRYLITVPLAVIFFIGFHDLLQAPLAALVLAGGLMAAAQIWLFLRFGILTIVAAEAGLSMLNLAVPALLQPSSGLSTIGWQTAVSLMLLLCGSLVLLWKAPDIPDEADASSEPLNERSEREALQSEFLIAQRAQREMLPSQPPIVDGYSLAASCTPAREVGGDLYDFLPLSAGRLGIAVADVSGKGVPAALYMTLTKGLLAATSQDDLPLDSMLEQINAHLCTVGQRKTFVTMALGILDPATKSFEYGRAGHNPAVWRRSSAGSTSLLNSKGLGLGITAGRVFGRTLIVEKLALSSGDTLVFYSDGLTEAMNGDLEQFGEERLMHVVERVDHLPAGPARDAILREVAEFLGGQPPQDDLTLVVLHVD